jgi:hypothetical protein
LVVLEYVGLWRGVGGLDEAGDIDGGQAIAVFVFEQAVVVEQARGEGGRAEQRTQFLDVVEVVEGDGPAEAADDVIQIASEGAGLHGASALMYSREPLGATRYWLCHS